MAVLSGFAGIAHAQITWDPTTIHSITGPSDISTLGSSVDAIGINNFGSAITIGDTTFNPFFSDSGITISGPIAGGTDGSGSTATAYQTVLDGVAFVGFTPAVLTGTITLNNLTIGDNYQVQVWNDGGRVTPITGSNTVSLSHQFVLGTFTAGSTTESFIWQNVPNDAGEIDAVALREVPEPSTYAMMLGGAAALALFVRRKTVLLS